ncbi:MAG: MoaD/ThiS family protein [Nitrososphaerota archaeon]|nr:MoaD/ThiS family protein [Candidatus Bathyarchaeota archaeon]MDW8193888.1 MoaD/ThiS family protein [Nitrososphaerota archaeon]
MRVKVEYIGHIKKLIGSGSEEIVEVSDGALLEDLLTMLSNKYGAAFRMAVYAPGDSDLKQGYIATVNGYLINQLNGVKTKLKDGDNVILTSIVSGG